MTFPSETRGRRASRDNSQGSTPKKREPSAPPMSKARRGLLGPLARLNSQPRSTGRWPVETSLAKVPRGAR
eukprot:12482849-Alexandrium_andersonii.AAC.1